MESRLIDPIALMYHELRAPLGLVATAARSMAEDAPDPDLRTRCELIVRAAERMLRTAEAVRDLDRAIGPGPAETFSPAEVTEDLVSTLRGLGVRVTFEQDVPPAFTLVGSSERFEALVHSLISNALDHGIAGEPIVVRLAPHEKQLALEVVNAVAAEDRHRGSGLGSIIVNALARGFAAQAETSIEAGRHCSRLTFPQAPVRGRSAADGSAQSA